MTLLLSLCVDARDYRKTGNTIAFDNLAIEILKKCRELNIHTAIETSGFASLKVFKEVLQYCDFVLFDVKETNKEKHVLYTGVSFDVIYENLKFLNIIKEML